LQRKRLETSLFVANNIQRRTQSCRNYFFQLSAPGKKKRRRTHVDDLHILELEIFLHQLYEAAGEDSVKCHQRTSKMKLKKKTQNKIKNPNPTLTNFGAIRAARVMVFSGGGPPLTLPIISKESPEGTAFTVPFNHPVAIFSLLALPCLDPSFFSEDHQDHPTH
jgi:hypothetical protein